MEFKLQRFADVIHGTSGGDYGSNIGDNTQVYGLAGNDTIKTNNSKNVLLIGGSGNDVIQMTGGNGTLNGGDGADTFKFNYSSANTISAVIEDIDPVNDRLIINYTGSGTPKINYSTVGKDIVLTDDAGYFNVTLKGYREANDYFDGTANENIWEVFKIVNQERENQGLGQLILSQGLIESASIRAVEIEDTWGHTRPDGTSCFTAVEKSYSGMGENIAAGYGSPEAVMVGWMNSTGHRANILRDYFTKIGVGYFYKSGSYYGNYWVQMFGGDLNETETVSTAAILSTKTTLTTNGVTQSALTLGSISDLRRTTVSGTAGADLLINGRWYGEKGTQNVEILALGGNDTISNSGSNSVLDGGNGNDEIHNGYYYYDSGGYYKESYDSEYDDEYGSSNVTISGGNGSDTIQNTGDAAIISGGNDSDSVSNTGDSVTVNGEAGNDFIINGRWYGEKGGVRVKLYGGTGSDTITNSGSNSVLDGGDGDDFIYNGYYFYANGSYYEESYNGNYDDANGSSRVTISGGVGDDEIHSRGAGSNVFLYNSGDGFDTVYGYSSGDTISITGGAYAKSTVGSNVIVSVGSGAMTLVNASDKTINIHGESNENLSVGKHVYSFEESVGANADPMDIYYYRPENWTAGDAIALVLHGMNRDAERYLSDWQAHADENNVLLICPEFTEEKYPGSNYYNIGNVVSNGKLQDEEEWIFPVLNRIINDVKNRAQSPSSKALLFGHSAGAQLVHRYAIFNDAEDFDVIIPANAGWYTMPDSTIQFPYGLSGTSITDEELIATLAKPVVILLGEQDTIRDDNLRTTPEADAQGENRLERGKNFYQQMKSKAESLDVPFNWKISIVEGVGHNDYKMAAAAMDIYADFLETGEIIVPETLPAGVSISNATLTASTAFTGNSINLADYATTVTRVNASALSRGVSIVGNAKANSIKGGKSADTIFGGAGNDTVSLGGGADVYIYSSGNDLIQDYVAGTDKIKLSGTSITSASLSGSDVMLKTSAGNLTVKNGKNKAITVIDASGKETSQVYPLSTLPAGISVSGTVLTATAAFTGSEINLADYATNVTKVNASAVTKNISIVGSSAANSLKGGKGADTIFGGVGNDTVSLGGGADVYVYSSGNDLIQDYAAGTDKIKLSGTSITSASVSGSNVVLKTSSGNITVKGRKGKAITVIDASGKETSQVYPLSTLPAGISVSGSTLTASSAFTGSEIDLADYATNVTKVNASALSRGVSIVGNAKANSLKGGKGADTIFGGAGNDTVSLGGGADVYIYSSGNDLIQDYAAGTDKIKLSGTSITSASVSGSNVVLKTSSGNITVKGRKGKAITVIDASGKETSQVYPLSTLPAGISVSGATLTASSAFIGSEIDLADYATNVTKVNASALSRGVSIVGNAKANSLKGGKGADTIFGGAGNDTLYGGAGSDTFVYASGKDVIADYAAGDKIKLTSGTISKTAYSGQNVVFTVGSGSLTVRNGKSKKITITDASGRTSTKTYTTGVSYGSNGNVAVPWFTEDDTNFISASANLDEISAEKFSVTNVESTNYENPMQPDLIIIPGDK